MWRFETLFLLFCATIAGFGYKQSMVVVRAG